MPLPVFLAAIAEALSTTSTSSIPAYLSKNSRFAGPDLARIERSGNVGGGTLWTVTLPGRANVNRNDFLGDGVATVYQTTIPFVALANNNWIVQIDKSTRTGTVATTAGSNVVTGTTTAFTTELRIGQEIVINNERKVITAIASTTSLTVDTVYVNTNAGVIVNLFNDIAIATTDFTVSNVGGFAAITFGAAAKAPLNSRFSVNFVVPVAVLTFLTATTFFLDREIIGGDVAWFVTDATATPSATNVYLYDLGT